MSELRDQLVAMRIRWDDKRKAHERRLETSDGGATNAVVCRDLCAQAVAELDQVLEALEVARG